MALAAKILIVDDDVEMQQLLGEELHDLGHESIYAADGTQTLWMVRRKRPDLILLDLGLPGGDGFWVLERLGNIDDAASIPVIVFSGMRSPEAEERALTLGAREFVHKSLRNNDLAHAIARALHRVPASGRGHLPTAQRPQGLAVGPPLDARPPAPRAARGFSV
jgi:two-component system phosphate regulon response regulator PhoB/two-component system alkaline phosphatase synthesis response regulator PhoP